MEGLQLQVKFCHQIIASGLDNLETNSLPLLPLNYCFINMIIRSLGHPHVLPKEIKIVLHFQEGEDEAVQHRM